MKWKTDKPQGDIIVAKVKEDFCYKKDCYEVLHFVSKPYPHYSDAWCEEVPYSAIEKWASLKDEEPVSEDLEDACEQLAENARKHKAETSSPFFSQTDYRQGLMDGAKWKKEQMMKEAIDTTIKQGCTDLGIFIKGLDKNKFSFGDKVKVIVIKED